jgi:hypothetical protein
MRITDVDPDLIPADDDRWESVRPSPWPGCALTVVACLLGLAIGVLIGWALT